MARKYGLLLLIGLLASMMLASEAQAQGGGARGRGPGGGGGPMGGGGGGVLMLVQNEKVQKELEIVDEQKTKLTALAEEQRTSMRELFSSTQDASREERQTKMQAEQEKFQKKLAEILLPKQLERVKQIQIQAELAMGLISPDVLKALNVTSEQQGKITAANDEAQTKRRDARTSMQSLSQEERQTKMREMNKQLLDKVLEILTADQRAQLVKMQGEKIDIDFSTLMRQGGGRRGGAGGPPPGGPPPGGPAQ
jgi:Spy/CpxP family protein refolding chaperone